MVFKSIFKRRLGTGFYGQRYTVYKGVKKVDYSPHFEDVDITFIKEGKEYTETIEEIEYVRTDEDIRMQLLTTPAGTTIWLYEPTRVTVRYDDRINTDYLSIEKG